MADLPREVIESLGKAAGIELKEPFLTEVTYNLNALRELLEEFACPGLEQVEPLPIIPPHKRRWNEQS